MSAPERADQFRAWVGPRARIVASALAVGFVVGALAMLVLSARTGARPASTQVFALAALVLGFGVLGWSGSMFAGRAVEEMQTYLDTGTHWTERDSRRAMTRIASAGAGAMLAVVVVTPVL